MNKKSLRSILIFGIVSILGIISIQTYFINKSFNIESKRLNQTISIALRNVAETMLKMNNHTIDYTNPIFEYSDDYYIVNVNNTIDAGVLEELLILEFESRNINLDFEYAIYDCHSDRMVYGSYIKSFKKHSSSPYKTLPKCDEYVYYFGVSFPTMKRSIISGLSVWYFFSIVLIIVILFFSYSIFIILRQSMLSEQQTNFINNITHELKTPLTSIMISSDVISNQVEKNETEEIPKYSGIIKSQSSHLLKHIENILLYAHTDKKYKLNVETVDLLDTINETLSAFDTILKKRDGIIQVKNNSDKTKILADKFHLRNVISNLIDNAIKYCEKNPVIIINIEKSGNKIYLVIKDNGIGISEKNIKKVFNRFYRVPTGDVHDVKGFGIGLSYVKNIIKLLGWKIDIKSNPGVGTQVTVWCG